MALTAHLRSVLIAALAGTTIVGTITSANAEGTRLQSSDAPVTNPNEQGLIELYSTPDPGQVTPMSWEGSLGGWAPGNNESRHWDDNDYTEIIFTGCTMFGAVGKSAGVKLWQSIPFSFDKDMGTQTFYNCFNSPTSSTRAWWNVHHEGGDKRYFTIPQLNGSIYTRATVSVKTVYVDTDLAD